MIISDQTSRELTEITTLYESTRALASSSNLRECLHAVMEILAQRKQMFNGTVSIVAPGTAHVEIEVAHGMSDKARKKGRYQVGEGITGRVVASGSPIVVPQISEEPLFLNRTQSRGDISNRTVSFLCVPIKHGPQTIGALSIDKEYKPEVDLDKDVRFLLVLSGLIAQTVMRIIAVNKEKKKLEQENRLLRRELGKKYRIGNLVSNSSRMQEVFEMIHRVADSNATILLRGESGTGKTLVAKAIHYNSQRSSRPCVTVNCAALPETLLESELFGYEKGAFTGATASKKGRFEQAEGGTLFLDEIGEISTAVQIKLLNIIQEREFQRLGGVETVSCDVRLVTATNRDLEEAVADGRFREDLYYRLNVFPVYLPPLRERKTDILLLAEYFLEKYSKENNTDISRISTPAIDLLVQYHWPGNVRELENCMERATLICDDDTIKSYHLPPTLQSADSVNAATPLSLAASVENFERELIVDSLKKTGGNQTKTAELLGSSLRIINYKVHKYDIDPRDFKVNL